MSSAWDFTGYDDRSLASGAKPGSRLK